MNLQKRIHIPVLFGLLLLSPTQAFAVEIFGRLTLALDGYQGYHSTLTEKLDVMVQGNKGKTKHDGFFHLSSQSIYLNAGNGPVKFAGNLDKVSVKLAGARITLPVEWVGWKVGNRVFLQEINCFIDAQGGAFCTIKSDTRTKMLGRFATRFSIVDLREELRQPVPGEPSRPQPTHMIPADEFREVIPETSQPSSHPMMQPRQPAPRQPVARPSQPVAPVEPVKPIEPVRPKAPVKKKKTYEPLEIIGPSD